MLLLLYKIIIKLINILLLKYTHMFMLALKQNTFKNLQKIQKKKLRKYQNIEYNLHILE